MHFGERIKEPRRGLIGHQNIPMAVHHHRWKRFVLAQHQTFQNTRYTFHSKLYSLRPPSRSAHSRPPAAMCCGREGEYRALEQFPSKFHGSGTLRPLSIKLMCRCDPPVSRDKSNWLLPRMSRQCRNNSPSSLASGIELPFAVFIGNDSRKCAIISSLWRSKLACPIPPCWSLLGRRGNGSSSTAMY